MSPELQKLEGRFKSLKSEFQILTRNLKEKEENIKISNETIDSIEKSRYIFQEVARQTQQNFSKPVKNIVEMALKLVFEEDIGFDLEFENKRGKTECKFSITDIYGNKTDVLFGNGGGYADIVSFALRCAAWSLVKNRPLIILDEPFKGVSEEKNYRKNCAEMIKQISHRLNLQIIMVTHFTEFAETSDKLFWVNKKGEESFVVEK